jgi:hypothetical protein
MSKQPFEFSPKDPASEGYNPNSPGARHFRDHLRANEDQDRRLSDPSDASPGARPGARQDRPWHANVPQQRDMLDALAYMSNEDRQRVRAHQALTISGIAEDLAQREREMQIARDIAEGNAGKHLTDYQKYLKQLGLD